MNFFPIYAEQVLNLGSLPDQLESDLGLAVDPRNDDHLRHVIRKVIAPYFARWDEESQHHLQRILALGLLQNDEVWFTRVWESDLPPFDLTDPPRHFFELLWDELFGATRPEEIVVDITSAEIDFDPTACNRMRVAPSDSPDFPPDVLPVPSPSN